MRHAVICLLAAVLYFNGPCNCYRILGLFPTPIRSHFNFAEVILKELTRNGHEVHVVNHFPQNNQIPGYVDISIKGSVPILNNISIDETANKFIPDIATDLYKYLGRDLCENIVNHTSIKGLRHSTNKYDLILAEVHGTDCLIAFADVFSAPIVGISVAGYLPWALERMGNPDNPSYITNFFIPFSGKMILLEKMQVALATIFTKLGYYALSTIPSEMRVRDIFGNHIRPLDEIAFNTSLLLVNAHFSINDPKPIVPGLIEIGGLHIDNNGDKSLPKDLYPYTYTKEGVIYLSFGTILNLTTIEKEKLTSLIKSLGKLPQIVFIKSDINLGLKEIPKNVLIRNWYPQLNILCNPNTKLFITNGGALSIQEAAHCGLPILGIPIFPENELLIRSYVSKGAGIKIDYADLINESIIDETLNELLTNNSYKTSAQKLSILFNDRPIKPLDNAIYWIEYILKYGGAPQLRSRAIDTIWFEYYMLDIAIVFAILAILLMFLMVNILEFLQNYFDAPLEQRTENHKKQQ